MSQELERTSTIRVASRTPWARVTPAMAFPTRSPHSSTTPALKTGSLSPDFPEKPTQDVPNPLRPFVLSSDHSSVHHSSIPSLIRHRGRESLRRRISLSLGTVRSTCPVSSSSMRARIRLAPPRIQFGEDIIHEDDGFLSPGLPDGGSLHQTESQRCSPPLPSRAVLPEIPNFLSLHHTQAEGRPCGGPPPWSQDVRSLARDSWSAASKGLDDLLTLPGSLDPQPRLILQAARRGPRNPPVIGGKDVPPSFHPTEPLFHHPGPALREPSIPHLHGPRPSPVPQGSVPLAQDVPESL